ncbi:MAG TPA: Fic family protein [Alphaproteobacteria bacterium]|nr:Fic family protein [Alphaproteobacteria bacterium]
MVPPRTTGQYVLQTEGYRAFIPKPLSAIVDVQIDADLQVQLSKADRALGRLDGSIQTLPDPDLFIFMYVRKEAVLSSQIEGTQASINDLLEAEAKILDPAHPNDVAEVLNYVKAMNFGLKRLDELPLSLRLLREIHAKLMQGVRGGTLTPGEFRRTQNWIGPQGTTLSDATFVPPPPSTLNDALGDLEKFFNSATSLPPLIKIGLIHAQFETIHPFLDGNGRVGRLLITFLLCQQEILQSPVLYLSHYLKKHRARYYDLLQATRDSGDWERWLKFFLQGIAEVSNEATETARRIVELREEHRNIITATFGRAAANGLTLLEHLFANPIISVNRAAEVLNVGYPTANNLLARFVTNRLTNEITGNVRNRRFSYQPYIRLFADS